ncbi:MAG: family 78 glycoside hydrolase catalytic domain [Kiritimatiellia bacterium]
MTVPDLLQNARWIEADWAGSPHAGAPAPVFSTTFTLDHDVSDAVLTWTCLGIAEVTLDGHPVHDGVFLPGWTDLRKRLRVMRIELDTLSAGTHTLEAIVGDGWAVGHVANQPRQQGADRVRFLARLCWAGGECVTDDTWRVRPSPIVQNDLIMGEIHDARLADASGPVRTAVLSNFQPPDLHLHTDPVVRRQETFEATECEQAGNQRVFDLGQNIAGRMRIKVRGLRGASVILRHAEMVNPDGSLYLENLRGAKATDVYTLSGNGDEEWEPSFTFHGFRYVSAESIGGDIELLSLTGVALYTDMARIGDFTCSHPLLNQLFHNIVWGQNGNFLEAPTDCPQRDERLGWTGDAQVFAPTAAFLRDVRGFFTKWLTDLRDSQRENGPVPCFAPDIGAFGLKADGGPAWADALILIPWYLYQAYGDLSFLADNYEAMVRYLDYLNREKVLDHIRAHPEKDDWGGFGDWLALDGSGNSFGNTPKDLIGTAFYARDAELMAAMADLLDKPKDAERWRNLHSDVRNAFQHRFLSPEGLPIGATQTSCVLALNFNLVSDAQRPGCVRELVRRIRKDGPKIGTGFVGTPYILQVLEDNGHLDLAYELLEREDFPSWLFPVTHGATTIWERWDGWHPGRGFQSPGMNSFNHYAYGAVGEWMIRSVAGLAPAEPGYRVIHFKPRPGGTLAEAGAELTTPYGRASIHWRKTDSGFEVDLQVPEGATGVLDLPDRDPEQLPSGSCHRLF